MSESQLPENYRSRIQQGFTASLLLTSLLFFWILVASNEPPRGSGGLIWGLGGLSPKHLAAGCLPPKQLAAGPPPPPPPPPLQFFPMPFFTHAPLPPDL